MTSLKEILFKLFRVLEIRSKAGVLHFRRWRLVERPLRRFFIHEIYEADADKHPHNHPWDFKALIVYGGYVEQTEEGEREVKPWMIVRKTRDQFHKVLRLRGSVSISLFYATGPYIEWGYQTEEGFILEPQYRKLKREGYWNR